MPSTTKNLEILLCLALAANNNFDDLKEQIKLDNLTVDTVLGQGITVLHVLANSGDIDLLIELVASDKLAWDDLIYLANDCGESPLHLLLSVCELDYLHTRMSDKTIPWSWKDLKEVIDYDGVSPLHILAARGAVDLLIKLVQTNSIAVADINNLNNHDYITPKDILVRVVQDINLLNRLVDAGILEFIDDSADEKTENKRRMSLR